MAIRIGTAGWSIARDAAGRFPAEGSALERYARVFGAVEINSSFHRPHRLSTWQRWGDSVPEGFCFSVKLPKAITHGARLVGCEEAIAQFASEVAGLGPKLAVVLVQLPPKLAFDAAIADRFFAGLARAIPVAIACEPRNASWFTPEVDAFLAEREVARVAADPALSADSARPGGWPALAYWRLHGSPMMYRSSYADRIGEIAGAIAGSAAAERWCMFDNTASSAATGDALALHDCLEVQVPRRRCADPAQARGDGGSARQSGQVSGGRGGHDMRNLWKLLADRRGATAIEYALVASLISIAGIAAFDHMGGEVSAKYAAVDGKLKG